MRYIPKPQESPAAECIRGFMNAQMAGRAEGKSWEETPVDYVHFTRGPELKKLLVEEQKGLCAYTGVGLDERLAARRPTNQVPPRTDYWFTPHIEHIKPQRQCREELVEQDRVVGQDAGEDLAYSNLVAALQVSGTAEEHFGAAHRGAKPIPIPPTDPACRTAFLYVESGDILGLSDIAWGTIENLRLDHPTP